MYIYINFYINLFENKASYKKILFRIFNLFFHIDSFPSCITNSETFRKVQKNVILV